MATQPGSIPRTTGWMPLLKYRYAVKSVVLICCRRRTPWAAWVLAFSLNLFAIDRQANTTLKLPLELPRSSPEGTFSTADAFPGLQFDHPVQVVNPPGDNRLFVVERTGRIIVIPDPVHPQPIVF